MIKQRSDRPRVTLLSPVGTSVNPYIGLLRNGLIAAGADVSLASRLDQVPSEGRDRPDVIHLHWLDYYDVPPAILAKRLHGRRDLVSRAARRAVETVGNLAPVSELRRWRRILKLLNGLKQMQRSGVRLAYTLHNLSPHEGGGWADRLGTRTLAKQADVLHVHDAEAARIVEEKYGRRTTVAVVPHGHYVDSYPNGVGRAEARARLGLQDDAFVFLSLGLLRPYKGLEELLPAFRDLASDRARLFLAGKPHDERYAATLTRLAASDPRVILVAEFVPPDQVQFFMNASDICVLPYRQITTSGAAMLSFSFGVPIIAPASGAFRQLVSRSRGILYEPGSPAGLVSALQESEQTNWLAHRQELLEWVSQFDWKSIGAMLLKAYGVQAPVIPASD